MIESNWKASGKPQNKSKKTPRKYQDWLRSFNVMRYELKKGINQNPLSDSGVCFLEALSS